MNKLAVRTVELAVFNGQLTRICKLTCCAAALVCGLAASHAHPGDGIVVDQEGTIFFVARNPLHDTDHHACIYRLPKGASKASPFYTSPHPSSNVYIVLGRDGHLYGAESNYLGERDGKDEYTTRVWRFAKDGSKTEVLGPRNGRSPYGGSAYLVNDAGTFYFAVESKIHKRTADGEETVFYETKGRDTGLDSKVFGMDWGADGEIYVLRIDRVEILAKDGSIRTLISGLENLPFDIEVDPERNVYLPDWRAQKVYKVTPEGTRSTILQSAQPWGAEGVALDGEDLVVLEFTGPPATNINPRLRVVRESGEITERFRFE